jgi:TRAP-type C4-dicarboxylate transport system permease small subunit
MMDRWDRIDEIVGRLEQILLGILLGTMILVAVIQIALRNVLSTGLAWGDQLVRNLVLWTGFIGAAVATREGKHISIDVVSRWISPKRKIDMEIITNGFSLLICALLTFAALKFVSNEIQMKSILFLGVPSWASEIILPVTLGVMTFRFCLRFLKSILMTRHQETGR